MSQPPTPVSVESLLITLRDIRAELDAYARGEIEQLGVLARISIIVRDVLTKAEHT